MIFGSPAEKIRDLLGKTENEKVRNRLERSSEKERERLKYII